MKVIWTLFKQNKFFNLLNITGSAVLFFLLLVLVVNIEHSSIETDAVQNFKDKNLYQISDRLYAEKENDFFFKKSNYDILNQFANNLAESREFEYYNAIWQPIGVLDFKGDTFFDAYYEIGNNQPPYTLNNKSYRTIKSMQLNSAVFELNNLQLESGRTFDGDEYIFEQKENTMPIILGSDFSSVYQLGDTIEIDYYQKQFKGTVIGFFSPLQKIVTATQPEIILDRYLIIPAMYFSEPPSRMVNNSLDNELFFKASLLSRSNGLIITEFSPLEIRKTINNIGLKVGFLDFEIIGANNLATNSLVKMTETNRNILYIATLLIFIINLTIFLFTLTIKIKKNMDTFLVLLISGANLNHIYKFVRYEFIIINLFACSIPTVIMLVLFHSFYLIANYLFIVAIFIFIMTLISKTLIKRTFNNIDLAQKLKG
ncbi:ABC transporter ATP-binding protein [Bacillus lacus]|uniref:ABC transporter ATP-binding protein n=1 Tax=Metabacillus lacus TaxID=1983721 RepID=A0A7X2IXH8_9BACI|nr:ABC transporter ATP-binding protein [Metabacillus lacus]MRX71470.1 ABC transporter ATP-binding protein [Metabacillus lacus]